jgi:hypothetical protein
MLGCGLSSRFRRDKPSIRVIANHGGVRVTVTGVLRVVRLLGAAVGLAFGKAVPVGTPACSLLFSLIECVEVPGPSQVP